MSIVLDKLIARASGEMKAPGRDMRKAIATAHSAATYAAIIADATAGDADITGTVTGDAITFNVAGNKYLTVTIAPAVTGGSAVTVTSAYGSNDGSAANFAGIIGYERGQVQTASGLGTYYVRYAKGDAVTVWRQARVWVVTDETIAAGATPYFRSTAGTADNQELGTLLAAAGSPVIGYSSAYVRVAQGASADGLVKLEINLP